MTDQELYIVEAMTKYGGSFVQALAECFHRADATNFAKLRETFSNYWEQYEGMVKEVK